MVMKGNPPGRRCAFRKPDATACRAKPLHNIDLCFWHDPEHKEEADKARQLGGQRRRRESITAALHLEVRSGPVVSPSSAASCEARPAWLW